MSTFRFLSFFIFSLLSILDVKASTPFITGDNFRSFANHILDEKSRRIYPEKVKERDIIFVKTDRKYLEKFFSEYHPRIEAPYILITHNSDASAPGEFEFFLRDPKILAWFGQNPSLTNHEKFHPIPIGIANPKYSHGSPSTFSKYVNFWENQKRPILAYLNFLDQNYPLERNFVRKLFAKEDWCHVSPPKRLNSYLQDLSNSKYVLSPRGNGLDTHRTWESLLMGAIPILKSSPLDPLFEDLPVLIIEDWSEISETFLEKQYEQIKQKTFNREKLFIQYWIDQIKSI